MAMNVSLNYSYSLENRDALLSNAKHILTSNGANGDNVQKIIDNAFLKTANTETLYNNAQLSVLKASTQITLNDSLKETLKYLKSHAKNTPKKQSVFGEIWKVFSVNNDASEENPYNGELYNFQIDKSAKNIFAA